MFCCMVDYSVCLGKLAGNCHEGHLNLMTCRLKLLKGLAFFSESLQSKYLVFSKQSSLSS